MPWSLNNVPVNVRTVLLAVVLLAGFALAADVGYRLLSDGATDMTLPASTGSPDQALQDESQRPDDLPE